MCCLAVTCAYLFLFLPFFVAEFSLIYHMKGLKGSLFGQVFGISWLLALLTISEYHYHSCIPRPLLLVKGARLLQLSCL